MSRTKHWDRAAPRYDDATALLERRLMARGRRWACARARGRVLEIGIGTGANLPYYAADVQLVGVDPSAAMLAQTRNKMAPGRAGQQGVGRSRVTEPALLRADAGALPFEAAGERQVDDAVAMLLAAGFGIGLVFYGVAEPMSHFSVPPYGLAEPETAEAARLALQYSFFNWGVSQWSAFCIVGLIKNRYRLNCNGRIPHMSGIISKDGNAVFK